MAPSEPTPKRQKLSPSEDVQASSSSSPPQIPSSPLSQDVPNNRSSWYSRTWPKKAPPITQVAKESISSASSIAIETASIVKDKVSSTPSRKSSLALTLGKSSSSKALPVEATATKDHALPQGKRLSRSRPSIQSSADTRPLTEDAAVSSKVNDQESKPSEVTPSPTAEVAQQAGTESSQVATAPRSWIGWLAGGDGTQSKAPATSQVSGGSEDIRPDKKIDEQTQNKAKAEPDLPPKSDRDQTDSKQLADTSATKQPPASLQRRSWLPIWNNANASQSAPVITSPTEPTKPNNDTTPAPETVQDVDKQAKKSDPSQADMGEIMAADSTQPNQAPGKSSAWIFWSRDKVAETRSLKDTPREGELAIANTETETKPRRASLDLQGPSKSQQPIPNGSEGQPPATGQQTKHKKKVSKASKQNENEIAPNTTKVENKVASATAVAPAEAKTSRPASPAPAKKTYEHLLLPSLHETLRIPENPSLLQQLARLFYSSKEPDLKHLNLVKDPPRIKNALAIGVHGYFPAPLIQSVIGRPTGTSIKFADMAARSIKRFTKAHGYDCNVKTAALEGEGKIAERIDLLWKLLLNWIDEIRKADFVMVACHSQGVPVAMLLIAKLIHFGCISSARVGICAMAGVNMGPFPEFKSRWMSGTAGELFEFSDPNSKVSLDYCTALEEVLHFGVRLTYVGSIDDQLVSIESSIFAPVSHPHIFRAVSIDSRLHAPSFVSHLVAFALKLRNLGVQDHGLLRELSAPLAGSLYTGEGHSRLYEDDAIYDLAVAFALETTSMPGMPLIKRNIESGANNPFILPFAMRGILEEDFVKSDLQGEAAQLLRQFDDWKPQTKALKDVKFRLEGIRSKL